MDDGQGSLPRIRMPTTEIWQAVGKVRTEPGRRTLDFLGLAYWKPSEPVVTHTRGNGPERPGKRKSTLCEPTRNAGDDGDDAKH